MKPLDDPFRRIFRLAFIRMREARQLIIGVMGKEEGILSLMGTHYIRYTDFVFEASILLFIFLSSYLLIVEVPTESPVHGMLNLERAGVEDAITVFEREARVSALHIVIFFYEILLGILIFTLETAGHRISMRRLMSSPNPYWINKVLRMTRLLVVTILYRLRKEGRPYDFVRSIYATRLIMAPHYSALSGLIAKSYLAMTVYGLMLVFLIYRGVSVRTDVIILAGFFVGLPSIPVFFYILVRPARTLFQTLEYEWAWALDKAYRGVPSPYLKFGKLGQRAWYYITEMLDPYRAGVFIVFMLMFSVMVIDIDPNTPPSAVLNSYGPILSKTLSPMGKVLEDNLSASTYKIVNFFILTLVGAVLYILTFLFKAFLEILYTYIYNGLVKASPYGRLLFVITSATLLGLVVLLIDSTLMFSWYLPVSAFILIITLLMIDAAGLRLIYLSERPRPVSSFLASYIKDLADTSISVLSNPYELRKNLEELSRLAFITYLADPALASTVILPLFCSKSNTLHGKRAQHLKPQVLKHYCTSLTYYPVNSSSWVIDNRTLLLLIRLATIILRKSQEESRSPPAPLAALLSISVLILKSRILAMFYSIKQHTYDMNYGELRKMVSLVRYARENSSYMLEVLTEEDARIMEEILEETLPEEYALFNSRINQT